jgi:hypothetical protein
LYHLQFDIAHLEANIALVQERARAEADWGDDESYGNIFFKLIFHVYHFSFP